MGADQGGLLAGEQRRRSTYAAAAAPSTTAAARDALTSSGPSSCICKQAHPCRSW